MFKIITRNSLKIAESAISQINRFKARAVGLRA